MTNAGRNKKVIERPNGPHLSDRERTVLLLAADGLTDKEIARNLGISLKTVGTYWDRMRQKSAASSRTQVLATFLRIQVADDQESGRLDRLFATWEEGVWVVGRDGRTQYANRRVSEIFDLDHQELDDKEPWDMLGPANGQKIKRLLRVGRGEPSSVDIASKDGAAGTRWLSLRAAPFAENNGRAKATVILVKDITVRKRVEYALTACQSSLRSIMDQSSDLVASFDPGLNLKYVNESFLNMLGVSEDELLGTHVSELPKVFAPNGRWAASLQKALRTGQDQRFSSSLAGMKGRLTTFLIAEPSGDFAPQNVISLTRSASGLLVPSK